MADPLPTITSGIDDWDSFEEDYYQDTTVRSDNADGRPLTRAGPAPALKVVRYMRRAINTADMLTWDTWQENTVYFGAEPWTWVDPRPGRSTMRVKLRAPIKFAPTRRKLGYYDALLSLIEEPEYSSASASPSASAS